jgi:hypothetical protein
MNYVDVCLFFLYSNINKQLIGGKKKKRERKIEYSSFKHEEKKFIGTNPIEFLFFFFLSLPV